MVSKCTFVTDNRCRTANMPFYRAKLVLCRFVTTQFLPLVKNASKSIAPVMRADCIYTGNYTPAPKERRVYSDPQKNWSSLNTGWFSKSLLNNSCKASLTKLATPLNQLYFLVPLLASLEKLHCTVLPLCQSVINFRRSFHSKYILQMLDFNTRFLLAWHVVEFIFVWIRCRLPVYLCVCP
jgi:hypothetical protein